ncbi:hypothetical protein WUBG_05408 [Wuchereria bancrofti]|uniref:Uncharacterized protein n=1 Tax=Wuchereria bancrofti TaxID=6293 RepID=J9F2J0_WUCBA|nr:hypothetical protein WUBG_05408 [Wuchereria bancrofti]
MGHLWSENKDFGLIYDADSLLLPILLGKNPYAPVRVYVADIGPSRLSRFAIKDLSDMATTKANVVMNTSYAELSDDGLVLGDGSLLASRYLYLKIRFDSSSQKGWDKLVPGTWIKFTASSPAGIPDFRIKTWNLTTNPLLVQIHALPTCSGYVFEACGFFEEELSAVKSTVFGFIEIPREKRLLMNPRDKGVTILWVREDKRNKRARFILYSVEALQTVDAGKDTEEKSLEPLMDEAEQCYVTEKVNLSSFHAEKSKGDNKNFCEFILPCKRIDCEGKQLLQRCFNNRAVVNSLIQASADELLAGIVKLLTAEKLES